MKRYILLLLIAFSCSDPDPGVNRKFIGTYNNRERTSDALISTEWKIWSDGRDNLVKIYITTVTDYTDITLSDITQHSSIRNVYVESETLLYFDNDYDNGIPDNRIRGQAIRNGQKLIADLIFIDGKGNAVNKVLEFDKKPGS